MSEREAILGRLFDAVAEQLLERVSTGEATPKDIENALRFLRDNGVNCDINALPEGTPEKELLKSLPFPTKTDLIEEGRNFG